VRRQSPPGAGGCVTIREVSYEYATMTVDCPANPCGGGVGYRSMRALRRVTVERLDYEDDAVRSRIRLRHAIEATLVNE
jgi:hypothetical protein